jgi:hypothetical protein
MRALDARLPAQKAPINPLRLPALPGDEEVFPEGVEGLTQAEVRAVLVRAADAKSKGVGGTHEECPGHGRDCQCVGCRATWNKAHDAEMAAIRARAIAERVAEERLKDSTLFVPDVATPPPPPRDLATEARLRAEAIHLCVLAFEAHMDRGDLIDLVNREWRTAFGGGL